MQNSTNVFWRWLLFGAAVAVCLAAYAIALIGTQGLFGTTPDGLAAVFLIFVGLPWSLLATPLALLELPIIIGQATIVVAPLINLYILWKVCFPHE